MATYAFPRHILRSTPFPLRQLPYEIRDMVFKSGLVKGQDGQTPALLAALRSNREMYPQALEAYYSEPVGNEFELLWNSPAGLIWFDGLKTEVKKMVKATVKLCIPYDPHTPASATTAMTLTLHAALVTVPNITALAFYAPDAWAFCNVSTESDMMDRFFFQLPSPSTTLRMALFEHLSRVDIMIGKDSRLRGRDLEAGRAKEKMMKLLGDAMVRDFEGTKGRKFWVWEGEMLGNGKRKTLLKGVWAADMAL